MDADYFKAINDTYGHERGDEALRVIASAIRSVVRPEDICGRIGGEEFGVYLPTATVPLAVELAERLRAAVSAATFVPYHGAENLRLTMSVGCAVHSRATTYAELFAVADDELYVAKEQGRDRVRVATLEEGFEARAMPRLRQANQNRPPR